MFALFDSMHESGYTEFVLCEFMTIFGPEINLGTQDVSFETTILIDEEFLVDKPKGR